MSKKSKDIKETSEDAKTIKIKYQRFIKGIKVVVEASSLEEADKLFKKLSK